MPAQSTTATLPSSAHNLAPPHVMYEPIEETGIFGPFERYCAGGYFPAQIGYELRSSRYRIVDKLGHGSYSTTWLARDEHLAKYVAIKIGTSQSDRSAESTILTDLWEEEVCTIRSFAGVALVPDILDEFQVEGPEIQGVKWKHRCLVTTPARMSLSDAREASHKRVFQPIVARAIAAQLIQAVASLHARGIVHGGEHSREQIDVLWSLADQTSRSSRGQYSIPLASYHRPSHPRSALREVRTTCARRDNASGRPPVRPVGTALQRCTNLAWGSMRRCSAHRSTHHPQRLWRVFPTSDRLTSPVSHTPFITGTRDIPRAGSATVVSC